MIKRLIYVEDAIEALHEYFDGMLETDTVCPADIYGEFECIPSAQPEIIRCRDCKHYISVRNPWRETKACNRWADLLNTREDDYCSYAERKEDD